MTEPEYYGDVVIINGIAHTPWGSFAVEDAKTPSAEPPSAEPPTYDVFIVDKPWSPTWDARTTFGVRSLSELDQLEIAPLTWVKVARRDGRRPSEFEMRYLHRFGFSMIQHWTG